MMENLNIGNGQQDIFKQMDIQDDKILLCLLRHIEKPTDSDRSKIKALQKSKVTYSQVEIDNCLKLGYMRHITIGIENTIGGYNACSRIVTTRKGTEHIECLWSASQYNRKWIDKICQFSWSKFWAIALSCFLTALFSQILRSCEK